MSNEIVTTVDIRTQPGHLYFVDKDGDIAKRKRNPGRTPSGPGGVNHPNIKVLELGIRKEPGWLYFVGRGAKTIERCRMRSWSGRTGRTGRTGRRLVVKSRRPQT